MALETTEFERYLAMLRSADSLTYENGYQMLIGHVDDHLDDLVQLMICEKDASQRGRLVEVIGQSTNPKVISVLRDELKHETAEVRMWAFGALSYSELVEAREIAAKYSIENPNEEFL